MRYRILTTLSIILIVLPFVACSSPQPSTPVGDPATLIQEAKNALDGDNYDLAIGNLEQAIRLDANSAEAYFLLGNAYAQKEMLDQAVEQYLKALKIRADYTDARSNLGVAYYRQQKLQEAEKAFRVALSEQPNDAEVHYNLGGVLVALNRIDEGVSEFLKAKEIDPSLPEPYLGLGSVYKLQGKRDEAIASLREYIRLTQDPTWRKEAEQMILELGGKP